MRSGLFCHPPDDRSEVSMTAGVTAHRKLDCMTMALRLRAQARIEEVHNPYSSSLLRLHARLSWAESDLA